METKLKEIGNKNKVALAVIMRDEKILTGYRNYTKDKWKDISVWTIPGGRCEDGETLKDTLKREVQEEVGITEFEIIDYIGEVPAVTENDTIFIFFCTTKEDAKLMEPEKFSEWRWVSKNDYISDGEYNDGFNPKGRTTIVNYLQKIN
ncbi:MAG: NUDIX hydrolase [Candidatus Paceibacterota bacterium]|jgi:ADP-ribose pyrophosphatase YjhB (NUDIX family)